MALDLEKELTFVAFQQLGGNGRSARELGVTRDVGDRVAQDTHDPLGS